MGLGLLGRGIGDARFLAEQGTDLIVTDLKSEHELQKSVKELKNFPNIIFHLGGHRLEDFCGRDFILKSAGVPIDSPYIAEARKNNIPIEMSTSLFAKRAPATLIGVTGTRGKSTVTQLVFEVLKNTYAKINKNGKVFLGGNVQGVSTLALLPEIKKEDIVVLELDSWQLQGFGEAGISPHIAVFTTFLPDHLNYYKGDMGTYLADKANIFKNQKTDDVLILGNQVAPFVSAKYKNIQSKIIFAGSETVPPDWTLTMLGEHNRYNAGLALQTLRAVGIADSDSKKIIESFGGVAGRLQFLCEIKGVKIFNDTTATTPDATIAALKALSKGKNIILIMGGADKNLDMSGLYALLRTHTKKIILLPGSGTDRIKKDLTHGEIIFVQTLEEAVETAFRNAKAGDTILFSPAFSSFGLFKNEYDRGDQFNAIIKKIQISD